MMKAAVIVAALVTVLLASPVSAAGNLVNNGGFETGNFAGWTQFGDASFTQVYKPGLGVPVFDGNFSAFFGPGTGYGGITQTINTVPGQNYDVSFEFANSDNQANNQFFFSFNDGFQIEVGGLPPLNFGKLSLPVTASGLTADVSFFFYNPTGYFFLDDVSVTPSVPEPATWGLMLAGFATIGATMRRRQLLVA